MEPKIGIDYEALAEGLGMQKKTASVKKIAVKDNKHLFREAVADLFRKNDEDGLWKIETADDGNDYFIRTELSDPEESIVQESSEWSAVTDREKENVTLSYKNIPVKRFASSEFRFTKEDAGNFCKHVVDKTSDKEFRKHVFAELTPYTKDVLTKQCPELFK